MQFAAYRNTECETRNATIGIVPGFVGLSIVLESKTPTILFKRRDDIITGEESDSQGAVQTVVALGQMGIEVLAALVLDVTNEGWESGALFTLENDLGIDTLTGYNLVSSLEQYGGRFAFKHNALPDESWDYADYGIPSLTLCVPVGGELHGDAGVLLRKESATEYCNVLPLLAGVLC